MMSRCAAWAAVLLTAVGIGGLAAEDNRSLGDRTLQYLTDLVRLDTSNPPGNETRVANYLKQAADANGIQAEIIGGEPRRMNFVARLKGNGKARPLLLMAHSDVVPVERSQWTADPFGAEKKDGFIYGRGTMDTKGLLAAEMAVMVEIKRRDLKLNRDLILVAEADEEVGSSGIQWLIQHAWNKIDAEFAINEGGMVTDTKDGTKLFNIQTAEKIPTRVLVTAKGSAGHGSLPRSDNAVLHAMQAAIKLAEAEQPVRLNSTTRRYLREISKLDEYNWLAPLTAKLDNPSTSGTAAAQIRAHDPEIDALLRTTVAPTTMNAGSSLNVIPTTAEIGLDVRRLPNENRDDVLARFRQIVNDKQVTISFAPGTPMPATEPSSTTSALYKAIEKVVLAQHPHDSAIAPFMGRGATDGSFLRSKGMAVYGAPIFLREPGESRSHGNDERVSPQAVTDGVELLWQIVLETAGAN